eukprot:scaffold2544_cov245-Pinguiococcus_pyrenoidosus.AAC.14
MSATLIRKHGFHPLDQAYSPDIRGELRQQTRASSNLLAISSSDARAATLRPSFAPPMLPRTSSME